jgi:predicted metal-dependent hydrolase
MAKPAAPRNLPLYTDEEVQERLHLLHEGINQFNDRFFFEAHEILEELWMQSPWPTRRFLQGLIQMAAAFVHFVRHEYPGTVRLLGHAHEKLSDFSPRYLGVDVDSLLLAIQIARVEIQRLGPDRFTTFPAGRIPLVTYVSTESANV